MNLELENIFDDQNFEKKQNDETKIPDLNLETTGSETKSEISHHSPKKSMKK